MNIARNSCWGSPASIQAARVSTFSAFIVIVIVIVTDLIVHHYYNYVIVIVIIVYHNCAIVLYQWHILKEGMKLPTCVM